MSADDLRCEVASSYQEIVDVDVPVDFRRTGQDGVPHQLFSCLWNIVLRCFPRYRHAASRPAVNPEISNGLTPDSGRCGLINIGNTCYMNSALQCLSSTTPLRDYFTGEFLKHENRTDGALARSFSNLLLDMWSGKPVPTKPDELKKLVGGYGNRFSGFSQQDSQEFLTYLLEGLHEDLNIPTTVRADEETGVLSTEEEKRLSDEELADLNWTKYLVYNNSKIVELFHGQLKTSLTCGNEECVKVDRSFDPFMFLTVPVPDSTLIAPSTYEENVSGSEFCSLYDCLKLLTQEKCSEEKNWYSLRHSYSTYT